MQPRGSSSSRGRSRVSGSRFLPGARRGMPGVGRAAAPTSRSASSPIRYPTTGGGARAAVVERAGGGSGLTVLLRRVNPGPQGVPGPARTLFLLARTARFARVKSTRLPAYPFRRDLATRVARHTRGYSRPHPGDCRICMVSRPEGAGPASGDGCAPSMPVGRACALAAMRAVSIPVAPPVPPTTGCTQAAAQPGHAPPNGRLHHGRASHPRAACGV